MQPQKKIIHVDMDAFYASVEQLDNPELKGKPIAVGGGGERGVVAAASYEARTFGVRSAMSGRLARQKCPELIFVKPRFDRYKEVSNMVREVFFEYTDLVEPLSLDEAYLDVTENKKDMPSGTLIAEEIRAEILKRTGLTASAGISINKFLAKVASDINKPNGQKTINPDEVLQFMEHLPIEKFFGVGKVTAKKMKRLGIYNGSQLKEYSLGFLNENFGKSGQHYYNIVRGIQRSEVKPNRIRKSIGAERTFSEDYDDPEFLKEKLTKICEEVARRVGKLETAGRTITLKIKYQDFTQQTRSKTFDTPISSESVIMEASVSLLESKPLEKPIRLLGVSLNNLGNAEEKKVDVQLSLFDDEG